MKQYAVVNLQISNNVKSNIINKNAVNDLLTCILSPYKSDLIGLFTQTKPFEWQLVVHNISRCYDIVRDILTSLQLQDILCYAGIGIGPISTLESEDSRSMDGEAFILARNSIQIANAMVSPSKMITTKYCSVYLISSNDSLASKTNGNLTNSSDNPSSGDMKSKLTLDHVINTLIQNNEYLYHSMTHKQLESSKLYEETGTYQAMINKDSSLSKGAISSRIHNSNYWLICQNKRMISDLLKNYQTN